MSTAILVPIDGSAHANRALQFAIEAAKAYGDHLVLLNVQPDFQILRVKQFISAEQIREFTKERADAELKEAISIAEQSGVEYEAKFKTGYPKTEILAEAKDIGARLIVMGYKGNGPVTGKIMGSVSYGVLQDSTCPTTLVP